MIKGLLGGLINQEQIVKDTIQETFKILAEELKCDHKELCVTIMPTNEKMDFNFWLCRVTPKGPEPIRIIPIKEIFE